MVIKRLHQLVVLALDQRPNNGGSFENIEHSSRPAASYINWSIKIYYNAINANYDDVSSTFGYERSIINTSQVFGPIQMQWKYYVLLANKKKKGTLLAFTFNSLALSTVWYIWLDVNHSEQILVRITLFDPVNMKRKYIIIVSKRMAIFFLHITFRVRVVFFYIFRSIRAFYSFGSHLESIYVKVPRICSIRMFYSRHSLSSAYDEVTSMDQIDCSLNGLGRKLL